MNKNAPPKILEGALYQKGVHFPKDLCVHSHRSFFIATNKGLTSAVCIGRNIASQNGGKYNDRKSTDKY